jgi:serine/threonine-protein kinase
MSDPVDRLNEALSERYSIERKLGEGGMATVYLAEDLRHERKVALKVLKPELAAVVGGDRFLSEIKTTANLQHPHILPLFDSGEADSFLFYVMPFVDGESLQDRLHREKQLPVDEAISIATKVAGALQAAHDKGIVHRDIKPANILLANGEPLVADFGIALAVQHAGAGRLTETGLSLGTPYYMSPEQATADRDPDARSDQYSLACVLYEMLAGEPPFTGTTAQSVLGRILTQPPPSVCAERSSVPSHVDAVITRALQKLPADRFESATEMAVALADPARVTFVSTGGQAVQGSDPADSGSRRAGFAPWLVAVAGVAVGATALLRPIESVMPEPVRFTLAPLGAEAARAAGSISISANGREIVYEGASQGQTALYRRSLDGLEVTMIPETEGARWPSVSPDGRWVAFWTPDGSVRRSSLDGGSRTRIVDVPDAPIGISWSTDSTLVMGMLAYNGDYRGLTAARLGEREFQVVTEGERSEGFGMHHEPYALPDGEHALFADFSGGVGLGRASLLDGSWERLDLGGSVLRGGRSIVGLAGDVFVFIDAGDDLMAIQWDEEELRPVGEPIAVPGVPLGMSTAVLARDGTLAMPIRADSYRPVLIDDRGAVEREIADESIEWFFPRFSPDGRYAAIGGGPFGGADELWLYDLQTELLTQLGIGFRPALVEWTPEGSRVVAGTGRAPNRTDMPGLFSRAADASDEPSQLYEFTGRVAAGAAYAPDGGALAITENVGPDPSVRLHDIVIAGLDGDSAVTPFAAGESNEVGARFSPDGRWLAYASDESGRYQVYVRPYPGPGARVQVSAFGGGQPVWSSDGRRLFYRTDRAMMAADLSTDVDGGLRVNGRERLFEGDFFGGPDSPVATYDVHPDGTLFLMARAEESGSGQIVVWTSWLGEIRAQLGLVER